MDRPRVLIENWLPAAAIGVECIRERSTGQQPPDKRMHVWWARRPLCAARAAVLASVLPADFPRDVFERLLGFGRPGDELVSIRKVMDFGVRLDSGFGCGRAFRGRLRDDDLALAHQATQALWGGSLTVLDPMSGGGSIPLEAARLGFRTLSNEYNPVACSVLEATIDYPFRFGPELAKKARTWAAVWERNVAERLAPFYPKHSDGLVHAYVFARTVPCPNTGHPTPLVPDWYLLKPKSGRRVVAVPVVDNSAGTWTVVMREVGDQPGQLPEQQAPRPTYGRGKGLSLFTETTTPLAQPAAIPADWIKAQAQAGRMGCTLYAVIVKTPRGFDYQSPGPEDLAALVAAEQALAEFRAGWERDDVLPTEVFPSVATDLRPRLYGMPLWADMFTARQLLAMGVLVEELRSLRPTITEHEGPDASNAICHLLALVLDKFLNHNCLSTRFENTRGAIKGKMDRHDYAFKSTFAEYATCNAGLGLAWAVGNVLDAWEEIARFPKAPTASPASLTRGSATSLLRLDDNSITAVVVDPPYDDNVQYSELADFFYVWLKRTQGYRRPEWFSTYLCDHDQEAVVNHTRFLDRARKPGDAKAVAREHYRALMRTTFGECHRVLRHDGVLTVMFTHKKQEAWEALFSALIEAGFTITATWPVRTESEHSLNIAQKNAAESTVFLTCRKRSGDAEAGYFSETMRQEIRTAAQEAAERLQQQGLNATDQLVGSFGPAMAVYSRYASVKYDTGVPVSVGVALDEAADAVSDWRIKQLSTRGLEGVEPEGRFALLYWDVLGAAEVRFNEAKLLGHAVGMDVETLVAAGLVTKTGDKVLMLPAQERRRERALQPDEVVPTLFGPELVRRRRTKKEVLKVHPNDPNFRTALDACHALALRYTESGGGAGGIGSAQALRRSQTWTAESPVARLMEALVTAAPPAVRQEPSKKTDAAAKFPEFRAWHALLAPLFDIDPPDWTVRGPEQLALPGLGDGADDELDDELELDLEDDDMDDEEE